VYPDNSAAYCSGSEPYTISSSAGVSDTISSSGGVSFSLTAAAVCINASESARQIRSAPNRISFHIFTILQLLIGRYYEYKYYHKITRSPYPIPRFIGNSIEKPFSLSEKDEKVTFLFRRGFDIIFKSAPNRYDRRQL
jgi:hypothetical protein